MLRRQLVYLFKKLHKAICRVGGRGAPLRSLVRKHSVERASSADLGCSSEYSIENIED